MCEVCAIMGFVHGFEPESLVLEVQTVSEPPRLLGESRISHSPPPFVLCAQRPLGRVVTMETRQTTAILFCPVLNNFVSEVSS